MGVLGVEFGIHEGRIVRFSYFWRKHKKTRNHPIFILHY